MNDEITGNAEPSNNEAEDELGEEKPTPVETELVSDAEEESSTSCLLYTSDAADE